MSRPLRVEFDGAWYHVMNRGSDRRRIFFAPTDSAKFLGLLGEVSKIFELQIHSYCLMDNHYHLLVCTPSAGLGRAMRHLNGVYTQFVNRRLGRDGALFRGRYQAVLVDSDAYLLQASRYIHLNPVEAGIVDRPEEYPLSSYRAFIHRRSDFDWLCISTILGQLGVSSAGEAYRGFVEQGIDAELRAFHQTGRAGSVLGSESFRAAVRTRVERDRRHENREIPEARRLRPRPSLKAVAAAVVTAFEIDPNSLRSGAGGRRTRVALARSVALHLARHESGASLRSIAEWLGYRSYGTAATALTRFRRREEDPDLLPRLEQARLLLYKVET